MRLLIRSYCLKDIFAKVFTRFYNFCAFHFVTLISFSAEILGLT